MKTSWLRQPAALILPAFLLAFVFADFVHAHPVVINEIMYHPADGGDDLQYIELFNSGEEEVDLSGWHFTRGIRFEFPAGTRLGAGGYVVICGNRAAFEKAYGNRIAIAGEFTRKLSHKEDRMELVNGAKQVIDGFTYKDSNPWPLAPDGYGASLERISPSAPGIHPENWASSKLPESGPGGTPGRQNDSYSPNLPPVISQVRQEPSQASPGQKLLVTAEIADADGIQNAVLSYEFYSHGRQALTREVPMARTSGDPKQGSYSAEIEPAAAGTLIRYSIRALDSAGAGRRKPAAEEVCPTYSAYVAGQTNTARIGFGWLMHTGPVEQEGESLYNQPFRQAPVKEAKQGNGAFIYLAPGSTDVEVFDHVRIALRRGGFKVRFRRDRPFHAMSTINLIFEGSPRYLLSEPLAFELYRLAGVPAPLTEHVRLWRNGRLMGYHLLVEQPNRSFLERNGRDEEGSLFKIAWYGRNVTERYEQKNGEKGHEELGKLLQELNRSRGEAQWALIERSFNVDEVAGYFAVNMCISNWDGFFNNHYLYQDPRSGKWEIYPWDEDKTWGDFDGADSKYSWYTMPLTFGMAGDQPPSSRFFRGGGGPFGGTSWWRPPGDISGPLLANPAFRKRFLARLEELCNTVFTIEKMGPIFRELEDRLGPEVRVWALANGQNPTHALREFVQNMQSFHEQVKNRRQFILQELRREK